MASTRASPSHVADDRELLQAALSVASILPLGGPTGKAPVSGALAFSPLAVHFRPRKSINRGHVARIGHSFKSSVRNLQSAADEKVAELKEVMDRMVKGALSIEGIASSLEGAQVLLSRLRIPLPMPQRQVASNPFRAYNFAAILPGDNVATQVVASSVFNFLNIYNTLLICRLVLTWFPNPPQVIANPLSTICDPYLNLFRGIIPPLGGTLDFSPVLAFLVLNVFTNSAEALPAEMPRAAQETQAALSAPQEMVTLTPRQRELLDKAMGASLRAPSLTDSAIPKQP